MRFTTPARKALVVAVLLAVNVALALLFDALHSEVASIVLTVLIHVGVTVVLAIVAWRGGFLAWAIYSNANREQSAVSALFGLAIYGVVALGIVVGGFAHLVRRIVAMLRDGPIWA